MGEPVSRTALLREQFDLTWSLFELHLDQLTPEVLTWEPAPVSWNVRVGSDGMWRPDWDESDFDPLPVPTVGWLTWHIGWWWTSALDTLEGRVPLERTEITWPGDLASVLVWLRDLHSRWVMLVDGMSDADLDAPSAYPWGPGTDKTVAQTVAWLNAELMKNVAEIGQLRLLWAASRL